MKLSEAIIAGCKKHPEPSTEKFFRRISLGFAADVFGAAAAGVGLVDASYERLLEAYDSPQGVVGFLPDASEIRQMLFEQWPELSEPGLGAPNLFQEIEYMNDEGISREEIAKRLQEAGY